MPFIGNQPAESYSAFQKQDFSTSATTSYTLDHPVSNQNEIALFINFVRQEPTAAYTASGTTLTLTSATSSSDDMYCVYLGKAVQTVNPASGSVGSSQVASTIITGQTAETSIATDDTVLIHDTSAGALRKMTRANFVSGIGGDNTPYFSALKTSNQTVNHNTNTKITYDSVETESSSGVFDLTNNKFTCATAGKYCFQVKTTFFDTSNNLDRMDCYIYKNGSQNRKEIFFDNGGNIREFCITVSWIEDVSVSDYYELYAYATTTDSGSYVVAASASGSAKETYFSAFKLIT